MAWNDICRLIERTKIDSKKIKESADGAERDIEILNKMYEKYEKIRDDNAVIDNICFHLFNVQADLEE